MTLDDLHDKIGYITFLYEDGLAFYVQTSFNPNLCPTARPGCIWDMLAGKNIPRRIFLSAMYDITDLEPTHLSAQSEFLKQWM